MLTEECTFKTTDVDKPRDWSRSDKYHRLLTHPGERMSTPSRVNEGVHTARLSSSPDILIFRGGLIQLGTVNGPLHTSSSHADRFVVLHGAVGQDL